MSVKAIFEIPNGFKIEKSSNIVDCETACCILSTKKQRRYTYAKRSGANIMLVQHMIICPVCGYRMPAYPLYTNTWLDQFSSLSARTPKNIVEKWCNDQSDASKDILYLNDVSQPLFETICYTCPECRYKSHNFSASTHCEIVYKRHKLTVLRRIEDTKSLLSASWVKKAISVEFPLYEELTFNFKNGHTSVCLRDRNMRRLVMRDVTGQKEALDGSFFAELLKFNKRIIRFTRKLFAREWQSDLPFSAAELDLTKFMLLTEFVGYPKVFYYSAPYTCGTYNISKLFGNEAKVLHHADQVKEQAWTIPWIKPRSVKKLIFSNPAFLFYENECAALFEIFGDINLYCAFLCMSNAFNILYMIREMSGTLDFFRDYAAVKGAKALKREMLLSDNFCRYAIYYGCISDKAKALEKDKWMSGVTIKEILYGTERVSTPILPDNLKISDCTINGFRFFWLCSKSDYCQAAKKLHNCLYSWRNRFSLHAYNPVVCVSKGTKLVAAIEICNESIIVQALSSSNKPMEYDQDLYEAYTRWRQKYGLFEDRQLEPYG